MARSSTTASKGAIYWIKGPEEYAQRISLDLAALDGKAEEMVSAITKDADRRMGEIILSGGINPTKKGGPRVLSGDMIGSIMSNTEINGRGRIQGEFGFAEDTPLWTVFQEEGTRTGIPQMLAYATARQEAIDQMNQSMLKTQWFPHLLGY